MKKGGRVKFTYQVDSCLQTSQSCIDKWNSHIFPFLNTGPGSLKIERKQIGLIIYILLTKREGRTGRISARGLDSTKKTEGRYSPSTVPSKLGQ